MKTITFLTFLLISSIVNAQECGEPGVKHWSTIVQLQSAQVKMHWTEVYEGIDTVCGVTYKTKKGQSQSLEVYGQPVINKMQNLLGFVTCADDGCEKEIHIADIEHNLVLKTELPITAHQFYLKGKWKDSSRDLLIEAESFSNGKALSPSRFLCSVVKEVHCERVL